MAKDFKELKTLLQNHEARISKLERICEGQVENVKSKQREKISVVEFLRSKKPKNNVQKILAVAYYLEYYKSFSSFNADDLRETLDAARQSAKKLNINAYINQNILNGHIENVKEKKDSKKAYRVTDSGKEFVKNGFEKSGK
jgi:hypothetical protein